MNFLPEHFQLHTWEDLQPWFEKLWNTNIESPTQLVTWLKQRSELESFVAEDLGKRYIAMTCNTVDEKAAEAYAFFSEKIQPEIAPYTNKLDKKLLACPFLESLTGDDFRIYLRTVRMNIAIFREENIPLFTELSNLAQQFSSVSGAMSIDLDGQELTLPQAAKLLQENNRDLRKRVYEAINDRRLANKQQLDEIMDQMVAIRHQIALNAGYANFRDYMFDAMGRFDYSPDDCFKFHDAVKDAIVPLIDELDKKRLDAMHVDSLRPYDFEVDPHGCDPLQPFSNADELVAKTLHIYKNIDPYFASCIDTMNSNHLLDLESRKGKAPGGYLYPLPLSGVPFIFMNAVGSLRDMVTMMHEGGHAIHAFLSKDLLLNDFKTVPSEVAELASMSMELISMEHWQTFFEKPSELKRAQEEQMEDILRTLPWVAAIDKFQHWMYTNPKHSVEERTQAWKTIHHEFGGKLTDWTGYENYQANMWQKQLHLFEVPFYYIEYAFAQLGAIAVWRNYLNDHQDCISKYKSALALGYTKTIGEIYHTAGISFDFSSDYLKELALFVRSRWN